MRPIAISLVVVLVSACQSGPRARDTSDDPCPASEPALVPGTSSHAVKTVFLVVLENQDWAAVKGSPSAPYINGTLLPSFAHAENYRNGGVHPSLPSYIALEAGSTLGVTTDDPPAVVPLPTPCHLVTYLEKVGLGWKAYAEGIDGTSCPVENRGRYAVRHDPFVYFEDVSGAPPGPVSARCTAHVRPFSELGPDLASDAIGAYNFLLPDVCNDGHDSCAPYHDRIRQSDEWLRRTLPVVMGSEAYQDGGAIIITWDEPASGDRPIGLIVVSPMAKAGYTSDVALSHASTLRTMQEILGVTPLLRDAARATSLADLFTGYP